MFLRDPFFEPANHWVIVWLGDLIAEELEQYLDEPGNAAYDEPISAFSRDLGRWYDHDFIWSEGSHEPTTARTLCQMNGVEPLEFVEAIAQKSGDANARCLLVLWNARRIDDSPRNFAEAPCTVSVAGNKNPLSPIPINAGTRSESLHLCQLRSHTRNLRQRYRWWSVPT